MLENGRYVLNLEKPWIDCYTTYAHLLAILQNDERTTEWIYSVFIQTYMNKDLRCNSWGQFYGPMPYEISFFELCKWLNVQKIRRDEITTDRERLLSYIKNELEKGYYVHLYIDHKYITSSEVNTVVHDAMVYGIDFEKGIVYAVDVFKGGIYEKRELLIDEFVDSVLKCVLPETDGLKGSIYSYRIRRQCDYEFNEENIWKSFRDYLLGSVPEYWLNYNSSNRDTMEFGINIYVPIIDFFKEVKSAGGKIDVRPLYFLRDHFIIMQRCMSYLKENYHRDGCGYDEIIDIYDKLIEMIDGVNILAFFVKKSQRFDKLEKVINDLETMQKMEKTIIGLLP